MNWQIKSLDEVCTKITDGAHQSPKTVDSGKPMASVKDLTRFGVDLSEARKISIEDFERLVKQGCQPQVGDVLIAKDGNSALDTVCNIKQPLDAVLLSSVAILRPNLNVLDSDFLKYYLSSKDVVDYFKSNFISGAAIPRVVLRDFRKAQIHLPELKIQKRIAKILSDLDDKIHLNNQINQTLEAIAQAIFKSWFIDFEPVRAKISAKQTGQDPELAAMYAISGKTQAELEQMAKEDFAELQATAALFPDELVESELGEVPKGWESCSFDKIAKAKKGKSITKKTALEGKIPVVAGGLEPAYFHNTHNVKAPVITVSASGANAGYVNLYHEDIWASDCSFISSEETPYIYSVYVLLKLKQREITDMQQGAAQPHVYPKDLSRLIFLDMPKSLWRKIETLLEKMFKQMSIRRQENDNLIQIRDTLLPKLLSGEIDVSTLADAESRSKEEQVA